MKLCYFPISFFSTVMGLSGMTIATQQLEALLHANTLPSDILASLTAGVFVVLLGMYTLKWLRYREAVVAEFSHPIKLHFFPTISISLLLLGVVFVDIDAAASFWLWTMGAGLHLIFTLKIISMWMHHTHFDITHMNPSWFIPAVGNIIVPVVGVVHAPVDISWFFFSVGFMFWVVLLVIFSNRAIFHHPLPAKLLPTLFILIAPPAVGFIAYFKLTQQATGFANVLYFFGLFMLLLLVVQAKRFMRLQFFLSWWAYSFPLAAMSIATFLKYHLAPQPAFYWLAIFLYVCLLGLIVLLMTRTLIAIQRNEICVAED